MRSPALPIAKDLRVLFFARSCFCPKTRPSEPIHLALSGIPEDSGHASKKPHFIFVVFCYDYFTKSIKLYFLKKARCQMHATENFPL